MVETALGGDRVLDKGSRHPCSGDEPPAERIPAELAPGNVSRCGELSTAAVDGVKGVPAMGTAGGSGTASEFAPIHDHADVCGAAFVREGHGVGEDAEERRDEDAEGEVVERL